MYTHAEIPYLSLPQLEELYAECIRQLDPEARKLVESDTPLSDGESIKIFHSRYLYDRIKLFKTPLES